MDLDKYHELERKFMFNDNKTMKKTIEIPVEIPEGHELIQEGNIYKIVEKKNKYPMELLSSTNIFKVSWVHDKKLFEKYITFIRLVETCKAWNKIDGFVADWEYSLQIKYCIKYTDDRISINDWAHFSEPLHFQSKETALLFLEAFREEIELVEDLI